MVRPLGFLILIFINTLVLGCKLDDDALRGNLHGNPSSPSISPDPITFTFPSTLNINESVGGPFSPGINSQPNSFSISPSLPSGMIMNSETGEISGAPTEYKALTEYTLTAHFSKKDISTSFSFLVQKYIQVSSSMNADDSDASIGDNSCDNGSGQCTLRAAIEEANYNYGQFQTTIDLSTGTYNLTTPINITREMNLNGSGAGSTIIDGQNLTNIIYASGSYNLEISGVTLQNGIQSSQLGGAAVYKSFGQLTLRNCSIDSNTSSSPTYGGGGVLARNSNLIIDNCTLINNTVSGAGKDGGAIHVIVGTANIKNSFFYNNNSSAGSGGGVTFRDSSGDIDSCTFELNIGAARGGAIYSWGNSVSAINVKNTTFHNNASVGFDGKEIATLHTTNMDLNLYFNTFYSDDSINKPLIEISGGGFKIFANIFSDNVAASNCSYVNSPVVTSLGYNLDSDTSCAAASDDLSGSPTFSGGLSLNSGSTKNFLQSMGSIGHDVIPKASCEVYSSVDQRDLPRFSDSLGDMCDIGSTELQ